MQEISHAAHLWILGGDTTGGTTSGDGVGKLASTKSMNIRYNSHTASIHVQEEAPLAVLPRAMEWVVTMWVSLLTAISTDTMVPRSGL